MSKSYPRRKLPRRDMFLSSPSQSSVSFQYEQDFEEKSKSQSIEETTDVPTTSSPQSTDAAKVNASHVTSVTATTSYLTTKMPYHVSAAKAYTLSNLSPALQSLGNSAEYSGSTSAFVPSIKAGFDPRNVEPEAGFVPISNIAGASSVPKLAFNVMEPSSPVQDVTQTRTDYSLEDYLDYDYKSVYVSLLY